MNEPKNTSCIGWYLFGTGDELKDEYWNIKWKILSEFWDGEILREMYREFRRTKWDKMNWEIYSSYHKEEIQQRQKEHYQKNKNEILERGKTYREKNKERIYEQRKEYRENNIEKINSRHKEYLRSKNITCECGGTFADIPYSKNKHLKTQKHNNFVNKK